MIIALYNAKVEPAKYRGQTEPYFRFQIKDDLKAARNDTTEA